LRISAKNPFNLAASPSRGFKRFFVFSSVILLGIAASLTVVAVLQYRWTTEASSAEEMRIGAELEALMIKWHRDLYGEFSAICIAMQVGPDFGARDTWKDYLDRYVEWNYALPRQSTPYVYRNPDLVGEVYIWETGGESRPKLYWLNLDTKRIEDSSVPPELVNLLPRLQANSANLQAAMDAWQLPNTKTDLLGRPSASANLGSTQSNPTAGWQFDVRAPAIVHPLFHHGVDNRISSDRPVDWIVITMDMSVLQKRILPKLATRYFGGLDGLDYKVGVIATGPKPRTIYSSDPGFGTQNVSEVDSSLSIFPRRPAAGVTPPGLLAQDGHSFRRSQWHSFVGPEWFPLFNYDSEPELWFLELQHRAGPLQVAINRARTKNLTLSACLLLLLASNIGVLSIAGGRAQEFARLQMEFVASISHELRTPLAAIYCAGENISDGVVADKAGIRSYGKLILAQASRLMKQVDRILLFASVRSGKDRYNVRPLNVTDLIECVRKQTADMMLQESMIFEENVEPEVPPVLGDMIAVCGCLENLVSNAVKYSGPDRRIRISATLRKVGNRAEEVAISVEDHGMGIRGSELKTIFEPFYRSPEAVYAQIQGTGLGLSLAKHLAEAIGGSLSVVSKVGVGSVFTLHLQVARSDSLGASTESLHDHMGDGR
jgi:two-component system sensor histidine kinase SenX3